MRWTSPSYLLASIATSIHVCSNLHAPCCTWSEKLGCLSEVAHVFSSPWIPHMQVSGFSFLNFIPQLALPNFHYFSRKCIYTSTEEMFAFSDSLTWKPLQFTKLSLLAFAFVNFALSYSFYYKMYIIINQFFLNFIFILIILPLEKVCEKPTTLHQAILH